VSRVDGCVVDAPRAARQDARNGRQSTLKIALCDTDAAPLHTPRHDRALRATRGAHHPMLAPMTSKYGTHGFQSLVSLVDRRLGQRWQLEILAVGLAFNILSFKAFGQGLLDFSDAPRTALTGPNAAVAIAAFIVATYLLPRLGAAFIWLIEQIENLHRHDRRHESRPAPFESGWVRLAQAREAALIERDSFWTERVDQELTARDRQRAERRRVHRQSFSVLFLFVVDLACPQSLALDLARLITGVGVARELLIVLYLAAGLRWCLAVLKNASPTTGLIYHPALAKQIGTRTKYFASTVRSR
jgi:hypothetical protein